MLKISRKVRGFFGLTFPFTLALHTNTNHLFRSYPLMVLSFAIKYDYPDVINATSIDRVVVKPALEVAEIFLPSGGCFLFIRVPSYRGATRTHSKSQSSIRQGSFAGKQRLGS